MSLSSATLLASICVECLLYGIALVVFALSAYLLLHHRRKNDSFWPMLASLAAILLICSLHLALALAGAVHAFRLPSQSPLAVTSHHRAGMSALYTTANAVADGCLIWRLWVVWERRARAVAVPVVFLAAATGCGYTASYFAFNAASHAWTTAFIAAALVTHTTVTGLIAWRLYKLHDALPNEMRPHEMRPQFVLLAINGGCYAILLLVLLILHVCGTAAAVVLRDSMVHITLLVPALSIIRITIARSQFESSISTSPYTDFPRRSDSPASFLQPVPHSPPAPLTFPLTPAATHEIPSPTLTSTTLAPISTDLPQIPPPSAYKEGQSCLGVCICCSSPQSAAGSSSLSFKPGHDLAMLL